MSVELSVITILTAIISVGVGFVFARLVKPGVVEVQELYREVVTEYPILDVFDIDQLAVTWIRAALNHADLETTQKQVNFAVAGIERVIDATSAASGVHLDFLKDFVRPAVNAVYSEIAQELLESDLLLESTEQDALSKMVINGLRP